MARGSSYGPVFFLQISVALFLIVSGLVGVMQYDSPLNEITRAVSRAFGGRGDILNVIISILELLAGAIIMLGLFARINARGLRYASLGIFLLWALRIVFYYILDGFLEPTILSWLHTVSPELVILASLWIISRRYV